MLSSRPGSARSWTYSGPLLTAGKTLYRRVVVIYRSLNTLILRVEFTSSEFLLARPEEFQRNPAIRQGAATQL